MRVPDFVVAKHGSWFLVEARDEKLRKRMHEIAATEAYMLGQAGEPFGDGLLFTWRDLDRFVRALENYGYEVAV